MLWTLAEISYNINSAYKMFTICFEINWHVTLSSENIFVLFFQQKSSNLIEVKI